MATVLCDFLVEASFCLSYINISPMLHVSAITITSNLCNVSWSVVDNLQEIEADRKAAEMQGRAVNTKLQTSTAPLSPKRDMKVISNYLLLISFP